MSATVEMPASTLDDRLYRLSVDHYNEMVETGILTPEDRVELIEGLLVRKMSKYPPHVGTVKRCNSTIEPRLPAGWRYRAEQPLVLLDSVPEPDGVIALGKPEDDFTRHPAAAETALVIELAEASLAFDRVEKRRVYARSGLPVYWLVNLVDMWVEVYTDPDPLALPSPTYRSRVVYVGGDVLPSLTLGDVQLDMPMVSQLLPPPRTSG